MLSEDAGTQAWLGAHQLAGLMQLHRTATGEELSIDWAPTSAADRALAVTAVAVVRTRVADALSSGHAVRARLSSGVDLGKALSEVNAVRQVDDWALASAGTPIDPATSSAMVRATIDVVTEALGGATASSPEWRKALDLLNLAPDASESRGGGLPPAVEQPCHGGFARGVRSDWRCRDEHLRDRRRRHRAGRTRAGRP
jgi:hypothetical protein